MIKADIRKVANDMFLFQELLFLMYSAAPRHRPFLTVWLRLTSVCLIYAKVKRHFTTTPVEVKPRAVAPVLLLQAGKKVLSSGGIMLTKITFSLEAQDTKLQFNHASAGKLECNDLRKSQKQRVKYSI